MTNTAVLREDDAPGKAAGAVAVVIPTLDEEQTIADVVRSLPRAIVSRVIVADGGSRDATAARAQAAGAEVIDAGPGYGRACLAATMAAEDADIVVFMDGDGADDADSIGRLVEPIRSGRYDFVIASRARASTGPSSAIAHSNVATARSHGRRNKHAKQITSADSRAASSPKAVFVIHRLQRRPQFAHAAGGLSERSASRNDRYAAPFQISCSVCWVASPNV